MWSFTVKVFLEKELYQLYINDILSHPNILLSYAIYYLRHKYMCVCVCVIVIRGTHKNFQFIHTKKLVISTHQHS